MGIDRPTLSDLNRAAVTWRKGSSSGANNECVEVARVPEWAGIRDSKCTGGPALIVPAYALGALVTALSSGAL
ncbi:DUF397 domain-containing protein [Streptomyces sp. NPDC048606]|uniref:DUF397 domain-containing protein n=1 Tax=Streptomyces sp. NPDC048606 TaxID=3154726 RepID=UPI00341CA476